MISMNEKIIYKLIDEAKEIASINKCCKHSEYTVGASLLTQNGKVYKGFNIENGGIQSICAERVAFAKALTNNEEKIIAIAIVGKNINNSSFIKTVPCGYCRQFMSEYADNNLKIYTFDEEENKLYSYTLEELLPEHFSL